MFKKRIKTEVVPANEYTDFSDRFEGDEKYATLRHVAIAASVPAITAVGTGLFMFNKFQSAISSLNLPVDVPIQQHTLAPVMAQIPSTIPINAIPQQTGIIADKSLEMLATILDPMIQVMVAISFPVASVIMIGACFFFMFGNSERAWNTIMNAGLGYVLIQMSPLFLEILRAIGKAV
ncbi:hypothetical protein ABE61_04350 [Lysinibacillus sphaericus]|uniref:hypothetical protein n=1 Tax=Lysinibacillus sphaericus TaxID=1421 RepID=UPI0018CEFB0E|nr:hypothetical protein [Lysinibacillus sphaericus]MBG9453325.1 hypothetical protein [Lysinibacillus sphaericus]MBG9477071.1 hypothetical protein [Lysinibacillus sphaericus]MBG9591153.1 hypothetical protein [Lysinibacillus sphaericus]MBG9592030.1 hypothetical protein [Lysinibacillus sphaericus]